MSRPQLTEEMRMIHDRCVVEPDAFEAWLQARDIAVQKLARGEYNFSIEEAQLRYICEDPILWCRAFMTEPDTGEPYEFWDYQADGVRAWFQDAVYQCGAEVGKTREIIGIIAWGECTGFGFTIKSPSILVGAPQQTHLDEIIMGLESHFGVAEGMDGKPPFIKRFWMKPKRTPHTLFRFKSGYAVKNQPGLVYFRPAGHDGEAFRGVHVSGMLLMDEAAKNKNPTIWSEFWRAGKPGCVRRIYSVPDGDNTTKYYQYTQQAVDNLPPDQPGWRRFYWPKTLMPAPFWSVARDKEYQSLYGGKESPGYQRNVLGLHGQQENPVWPWKLLESNLRSVPEYRAIRLSVDDERDEMDVECYRVDLKQEANRKHGEDVVLVDRSDNLDHLKDSATRREAMRRLLREMIEPVSGGVFWLGADLGFSNDPTEILLSQEVGHELRDIVRISARGVSYDLQCELIYCLDEMFGFQVELGVDFGSAGTAVVQMLTNLEIYEEGNYEDRLTGFNFATAVDAVDEEGEALNTTDKDGNEKAVRLPAKELATNLITARLQRRAWAMPYDTEVVNHHANHTAREGQKHRIFDKKNDHTIDARRVLILRKAFSNEVGAVDVFSSGVFKRNAA